MKITKILLIFGVVSFLGVGCSKGDSQQDALVTELQSQNKQLEARILQLESHAKMMSNEVHRLKGSMGEVVSVVNSMNLRNHAQASSKKGSVRKVAASANKSKKNLVSKKKAQNKAKKTKKVKHKEY